VGVGASVSGTIGLAKSSASAMVQMYFSKTKVPVSQLAAATAEPEDDTPLYMVDNEASDEMVSFARGYGQLIELAAGKGSGKDALYRVDRKKFQKGMKRSMAIGRYFGKRAEKKSTKTWRVKQIKTTFDASLTGSVGVVSVGGLATLEASFENKNF
jgi:hypothetical protein